MALKSITCSNIDMQMPKWSIFAVQKGTNSSLRHDSTNSRQRAAVTGLFLAQKWSILERKHKWAILATPYLLGTCRDWINILLPFSTWNWVAFKFKPIYK